MRIVHFGKYYPPDRGGIESVTEILAQGTARLGSSVVVVCFCPRGSEIQECGDRLKVRRIRESNKIASQPLSIAYVLACLEEARNAGIVHVHYPNILAAIATLLTPRSCRVVVHWHSDILNKGLLGWLIRPIERAMLNRADIVIAATKNYADASDAIRLVSSKTVVVPYGIKDPGAAACADNSIDESINIEEVSRHSRSFNQALSSIKGRRVILAVGRLVEYKGFQYLIRAMNYISRDSVLIIAGDGPTRKKLESIISESGIGDRVILLGRIDDAELNILYSLASIFCLPSIDRAEAFGVVLLEAMARGIPIVTTSIPGSGTSWVNADGVSGVNVPPRDSQTIATACNSILVSSQLGHKLSMGARSRFVTIFTENAFVEKIYSKYQTLTSKRVADQSIK